jgi:hypothetical protein
MNTTAVRVGTVDISRGYLLACLTSNQKDIKMVFY